MTNQMYIKLIYQKQGRLHCIIAKADCDVHSLDYVSKITNKCYKVDCLENSSHSIAGVNG